MRAHALLISEVHESGNSLHARTFTWGWVSVPSDDLDLGGFFTEANQEYAVLALTKPGAYVYLTARERHLHLHSHSDLACLN